MCKVAFLDFMFCSQNSKTDTQYFMSHVLILIVVFTAGKNIFSVNLNKFIKSANVFD